MAVNLLNVVDAIDAASGMRRRPPRDTDTIDSAVRGRRSYKLREPSSSARPSVRPSFSATARLVPVCRRDSTERAETVLPAQSSQSV